MTNFNNFITVSLIFNLIYSVHSDPINRDNVHQTDKIQTRRQDAIPILYVKGTHYEVGFMVGETFGKVIQDFVDDYGPLKDYLKIYEGNEEGKKVYQECYDVTNEYFPQYVIELKGMADGANVPFHKLFLIHLDDILLKNVKDQKTTDQGGVGCSSIIVNRPFVAQFLAHTEDALSETVNHFYIISAHITPSPQENGGKFDTREEKWEAMTYAGSLSGYASGHNYHGLVFSINTIFAKNLLRGKIPRVFITRALLASKANINDIVGLLTNDGAGTADAFHVNAGFLGETRCDRKFYSIEVTPLETEKKSKVTTRELAKGATSFHTNKLHYDDTCEEIRESGWYSSVAREARFQELTSGGPIQNVDDITRILGDTQPGEWQIFRDRDDDFVNTINLGVFDFKAETWTLWTNNPKTHNPLIRLPLRFTTFVSPSAQENVKCTVCLPCVISGVVSSVSNIFNVGLNTLENLFYRN